ncbi:MAG: hypothetical protein ABIC57_02140 [bacterium]
MLDKSKIYTGYSKHRFNPANGYPVDQPASKKFKRVKILFEDDISFYVESLTAQDSMGNGMRYSVKKRCFYLKEISVESKTVSHNICPFCIDAYRIKTVAEYQKLFTQSELVIEDGVVVKNQYGPAGRRAEKGDYERADLIIKNGAVVHDLTKVVAIGELIDQYSRLLRRAQSLGI